MYSNDEVIDAPAVLFDKGGAYTVLIVINPDLVVPFSNLLSLELLAMLLEDKRVIHMNKIYRPLSLNNSQKVCLFPISNLLAGS